MTDLPPGWEWATLGEIAKIIQGQSPPGSSYNRVGNGLPFFQGKAEFGDLYPEIRKWTTEPQKVAQHNDILLSIRAPVGPTNLAPSECSIGRGLAAIRAIEIEQKYILWALRASSDRLASQATGSTFEAVNGKQLASHLIPVPPLAEQRRIVAALEDHLSRLASGYRSMDLAQQRLAALRSAYLRQLRAEAIEHGGTMVALGDIATTSLGKMIDAKHNTGEPTPYLRNINVRWGSFDLNQISKAPMTDAERRRLMLRPGDLLVCEGGEPGRCAIWHGEGYMTFQKALHRVRAGSAVSIGWVAAMIEEAVRNRRADRLFTGTTIKHLPQEKLRSLKLPIPKLDLQRRLTDRLNEAVASQDRFRSSFGLAASRARHLRGALLAEAFAGRLVPQDPADEPASELLARIRAERAASVPKRRTRKATRPAQKETLL